MGGLIARDREAEGYELSSELSAALPMEVWRLDLEVERAREVSAAEATVLGLLKSGTSSLDALARAMGMGSDTRLAERVLVKLLAAGAIEARGEGFEVSAIGEAWRAAGSATGRERVTFEVRLDPVVGALEWVDHEACVFGTADTWTVELPATADGAFLERRAEVGELVRREGLPDEEERAPGEKRPPIDLRGLSVVSRRVHWRAIRLDIWRHPVRQDFQIVGHIGDAENPALTKLLAQHRLQEDRRRVVGR